MSFSVSAGVKGCCPGQKLSPIGYVSLTLLRSTPTPQIILSYSRPTQFSSPSPSSSHPSEATSVWCWVRKGQPHLGSWRAKWNFSFEAQCQNMHLQLGILAPPQPTPGSPSAVPWTEICGTGIHAGFCRFRSRPLQ